MEEKKKILFVVYRTEWWGCLDSYCRQECRAEDAICYVLPVPRYGRDDITFKVNFGKVDFHPEKLTPLLPEGALLADWQQFSLEQGFERIYIHNPYDNNSLTDTVELKYYSANLKPYTKKLIYVPHLVEPVPSEDFNCHVYDYVDVIYLPRESARFSLDVKYDSKVEVVPPGLPGYLDKLAGRGNGSGMPEGQGNLPQGPDKKQGSLQQEAGRKQEGISCEDGKKAGGPMKLLYCVSYSDLYHGTEKQLQKMRSLFGYVKRYPDIQLIFRPDEDIRAKRRMLDGKIWRGYEELVAEFKRNRIGIYDESPDLYKAAAEADGIMSRNHPMDLLFSLQGKYVLQVDFTQRQEPPSREERCTPAIWDAAVTERDGEIELLFVPGGTRLICRMVIPGGAEAVGGNALKHKNIDENTSEPGTNMRTENQKGPSPKAGKSKQMAVAAKKKGKRHLSGPKVEVLAEVPDEVAGGLNYMFIRRLGNCLYLLPCASDGIWKYNMDTGYFGKAYLPDAVAGPVSAAFSYGKYLYLALSVYPGILKYDTESEEIRVIDGWRGEMEAMVAPEYRKEPCFSWAAVQEGHMLYMASPQGDIWMEFDMERDTWQLRRMGLPGMRFVHMAKDGDRVWLLPYQGDEIALWNCASGEGRAVYAEGNRNREKGLAPYLFALDLGDAVAAFPQRETGHVLVIPKEAAGAAPPETGEAEVKKITSGIPCSPRDCPSEYRKKIGCGYQMVKQLESGAILAYEYYEGTFLLLDGKLGLTRRVPCRLDIEAVRRQQDVLWENGQARDGYPGRFNEGSSIPVMLENFIRHGREDRDRVREYYRRYYKAGGS